ncbi:hypothetical protein [Alicyclobacillus herbarius]|uniref:hypothetical protein n=1 Tax=Alicyclobacillus herbarius TaxID=122960 RepID=UPI000478FCF3|nr:hypothetical protein [Alicyclobacillus herbarius]
MTNKARKRSQTKSAQSHGHVKRNRSMRVPKPLWERVQSEAARLGLSAQEYLNLLLSLAETLRSGLVQNGVVDGKPLLLLMENPLFRTMLQWACQSAASIANADDAETETHPPRASAAPGARAPDSYTAPERFPAGEAPRWLYPGPGTPGTPQPNQNPPSAWPHSVAPRPPSAPTGPYWLE